MTVGSVEALVEALAEANDSPFGQLIKRQRGAQTLSQKAARFWENTSRHLQACKPAVILQETLIAPYSLA